MKKPVIMDITSSKSWCQLIWPRTFLFFSLFIIFLISLVSSSRTPVHYTDHCASIVPESTPTIPDFTSFPFLQTEAMYHAGGDRILGKKSSQFSFFYQEYISFRITRNIHKTNTNGVYQIQAHLIFRLPRNSTSGGSYYPKLRIILNGFWSEFSGKLCMVGSASWNSGEGNSLNLDAVLKLNSAKNSTIFTSLVSGTLESLSSPDDPNYFEPITLLALPSMSSYNYTLVSEGFDSGCPDGIDITQDLSLSLQPSICSTLSGRFNSFVLEYESKCNSLQNCAPFLEGIGYLPRVMSLYAIQCSEEKQRLRYSVGFPNSSESWYYPSSSNLSDKLVGEGSWDMKNNQLCIVACRILNVTDSLGNAHIGDCSFRLSLRYPAVWSIRNMNGIVGMVWTNRTVNDPGYFDRIKFRSSENDMGSVPGVKYEYTEIERAKRSCPMKKSLKNKEVRYPSGYSYDMRIDMWVKDSKGEFSWGSAVPVSVGDEFYGHGGSSYVYEGGSEMEADTSHSGPLNISYKLSFRPPGNLSMTRNDRVEISAEGIYDAETGHLCMVGCKNLGSYIQKSTDESVDCEILLNFQFPPLNSKNEFVIKGSIESTRKNTDPLFFKHLNVSSYAYYTGLAQQSIWRMDLEITMVLISNTLACVFVALQIFYVKKHRDVLPFISLVMLVVLTLGHMIPLVLNFEALLLQKQDARNFMLRSGGWLEVNEVIVRVVTMVAFLLQLRLLHLAWSARLGDGNKKGLWDAEKRTLFVSLPLYVIGGLIALFVNWRKKKYNTSMLSTAYSSHAVYSQHTLLGDLRSYAGLVLDGFLFPQILFNVFQISTQSAVCRSFYIGTTFVRLLPHAYDLYRAHHYIPRHFDGSDLYANHTADFYSTVWDVIIPFGGMVFAVIIHLQQKFGGRCILPRKYRESEAYEKVAVAEVSEGGISI